MRFKELGIATNGTLLDTRMNNVLLSNFDAVAVSLHKGPKLHESIGNLVNLVKQRGKGNYEPNIRANIVAEEFSQQELDEIVELLNGKVDRVRCVTYISEDMQTANDETVEGCPGPYRYMAILWNGDTLPCCHILSPGKWTLGNISDSSLLEVWNGHEYARLRKGNVEGTPCMGCQVKRL
jgi:radical SAM protein with 4Fe4S-binding SPASM domain